MTLTNRQTVSEFIECSDPIRMLTDATSIEFDKEADAEYESHPSTTEEIRLCLKDLKVRLGVVEMMHNFFVSSLLCSPWNNLMMSPSMEP